VSPILFQLHFVFPMFL